MGFPHPSMSSLLVAFKHMYCNNIYYCCRSSSLQDPESSLFRAHEEIEVLHKKVLSLESQLENTRTNISLLQELLQESCKREWEHLDLRKRMAEEQMTKAQKVVRKGKKEEERE